MRQQRTAPTRFRSPHLGHTLQALLMMATFAYAGLAIAHGPSRQKVIESVEIAAKPEAVWKVVGDWAGIHRWLPVASKTTAQGGVEPGATRDITLQSGDVVKEELRSYDNATMNYSYKIIAVDPKVLPVNTYSSTISVTPSADGGSKVEWKGAFYRSFMNNDPPPEQNDEAALKAVTGLYQLGLTNLKKLLESK